MNLDGSIPADNPSINGVRSHIYTYGHRNPQGLEFGPNGLLYSSEHGPGTDDELNLIVAGSNYGWPHVAGYRDNRGYVYANWSQSKGVACAALKFQEEFGEIPPRCRASGKANGRAPLCRRCARSSRCPKLRLPEVRWRDDRRGRSQHLFSPGERHCWLGKFRAADRHDDGTCVSGEAERRRAFGCRRERGALPNRKPLSGYRHRPRPAIVLHGHRQQRARTNDGSVGRKRSHVREPRIRSRVQTQ